jgi:Na+-translocating ferredoxin:NAD+ oxidoreductase RnfC subunit
LREHFPVSRAEISSRIREAGVVGAGGAGFPTHIKAQSRAEVVIANGCECEPLVQTDRYVLCEQAGDLLEGLGAMMLAVGATRGVVAVRKGMAADLQGLDYLVSGRAEMEVVRVADTYPAGDEHVLVYEATGRVVPQGGIPPDVGVVVCNLNTLVNVKRALDGTPVTSRMLSICGDIPNPGIAEVPIGTAVGDVLSLSGNNEGLDRKGILLSGVMMGEFCDDLSRPVDKRTGSVVVLPSDNQVIVRKSLPLETIVRRAASVCCQCRLCTDLCPRHLMGHAIEPHRIMRAISWSHDFAPDLAGAAFCSGCGLCGVYVCPMLLSPDRISFRVRAEMAGRGIGTDAPASAGVTPVRSGRLVPHARVSARTGVAPFERDLAWLGSLEPERVAVPLSQHVGVPASAAVAVGNRVKKGQTIGEVGPGDVGANVHASIAGVVTGVNSAVRIERR